MKTFIAFLSFFDIFGNSFAPTIGKSAKKNTYMGGVLGLLYTALTIYLIIDYGRNLVEKFDPMLVSHIDFNTTLQYTFDATFGYHFEIRTFYVNGRTEQQKFDDLVFLNSTANLNRILTIEAEYIADNVSYAIPFVNCDEMLNNTSDAILLADYPTSICIDRNFMTLNLQNSVDFRLAKILKVKIFQCVNTTAINNCLSPDKLNYYLTNYEIRPRYIYSNIIFDPHNYTTPFRNYLESFYSKLIHSPVQLSASHFVDIQNNRLITDAGVFWSDPFTIFVQKLVPVAYLVGAQEIETTTNGEMRIRLNQIEYQLCLNNF